MFWLVSCWWHISLVFPNELSSGLICHFVWADIPSSYVPPCLPTTRPDIVHTSKLTDRRVKKAWITVACTHGAIFDCHWSTSMWWTWRQSFHWSYTVKTSIIQLCNMKHFIIPRSVHLVSSSSQKFFSPLHNLPAVLPSSRCYAVHCFRYLFRHCYNFSAHTSFCNSSCRSRISLSALWLGRVPWKHPHAMSRPSRASGSVTTPTSSASSSADGMVTLDITAKVATQIQVYHADAVVSTDVTQPRDGGTLQHRCHVLKIGRSSLSACKTLLKVRLKNKKNKMTKTHSPRADEVAVYLQSLMKISILRRQTSSVESVACPTTATCPTSIVLFAGPSSVNLRPLYVPDSFQPPYYTVASRHHSTSRI